MKLGVLLIAAGMQKCVWPAENNYSVIGQKDSSRVIYYTRNKCRLIYFVINKSFD